MVLDLKWRNYHIYKWLIADWLAMVQPPVAAQLNSLGLVVGWPGEVRCLAQPPYRDSLRAGLSTDLFIVDRLDWKV